MKPDARPETTTHTGNNNLLNTNKNAHHRSSVYSSQRMGGNHYDRSNSSSYSHSLGTSRSAKSMGRFAELLP